MRERLSITNNRIQDGIELHETAAEQSNRYRRKIIFALPRSCWSHFCQCLMLYYCWSLYNRWNWNNWWIYKISLCLLYSLYLKNFAVLRHQYLRHFWIEQIYSSMLMISKNVINGSTSFIVVGFSVNTTIMLSVLSCFDPNKYLHIISYYLMLSLIIRKIDHIQCIISILSTSINIFCDYTVSPFSNWKVSYCFSCSKLLCCYLFLLRFIFKPLLQ